MAALVLRLLCLLILTATPPPPAGARAVLRFVTDGVQHSPITVGDILTLELEVHHPQGTVAVIPDVKKAWPGAPEMQKPEIRSQTRPQTKTGPDGDLITSARIRIVWFAPGEHFTPDLDVILTDAAGGRRTLTAAGVPVQVASVLTPQDTALRDIKPQAEMPAPPFWVWMLAALLCLLALGGLIWVYLARRRKKEAAPISAPARPPGETALAELARIAALNLPESGRFKEHYTLTGDCIRAYVEARFAVPALECTSAEIRAALAQKHLPVSLVNGFDAFFSEGDLVKFARYAPGYEEAQAYLAQARELVARTQPYEPAL